MNLQPQRHDQFFKALLSDLGRARAYLRAFLPEELQTALDLETLQLEDGSFIDDQLKASYSDLVFSVDTREGPPANLCFLLEHKSRPDETAVFQILHYISSAMLRRARNGEQPRLIIPILFYHGEKSWPYRPLQSHFAGLPEALRAYLPSYEYLYHNFEAIPDARIRKIPNRLLVSAFLVMKHYHDPSYLRRNAVFLLVGGYDEHGNYYPPLIVYFFSNVKGKQKEMKKIIDKLPPPVKSNIMSALEMFIEEGRAEGKAETTREHCLNMIELGLDDDTICKALKVTPAYVQELRRELEDEKSGK